MKTLLIALCAVVGTLWSTAARADEWNKKTVVTFNNPVEIPGMVLPPGTYVFKLADTMADRNIVQIFNKHENHIYATIIAIPDYRLQPTGKTVITFEERAAGSPEAVRAWFYPGDLYGEEFVYPQARAMELAKANKQTVPSMPSEMATNVKQPATSATAAMKTAPVKATQPSGEQVQVAQAIQTKPAAEQPVQRAAVQKPQMPKTASDMPLVGLLGLLFAGAATLLRGASKKTQTLATP